MGCVPFYWGDPDISKVFDMGGIIPFESDIDTFSMSREDYESRLPAIERNYRTALEYANTYDVLWNHGLSEFA
jgi:hypothetical protein